MRSTEEKLYEHIERMNRVIFYYYLIIKKVDEDNEIIEKIDKYNKLRMLYFQSRKKISEGVIKYSMQESIQLLQNEISKEILLYLQDIKK